MRRDLRAGPNSNSWLGIYGKCPAIPGAGFAADDLPDSGAEKVEEFVRRAADSHGSSGRYVEGYENDGVGSAGRAVGSD